MNTWKNWSGYQQSAPQHILKPNSIEDLQQIVQQHHKIRVVGAGHSFSAVAKTDDVLISLDGLQGLASYSAEKNQSTLWAGTRLYQLDDVLTPINQALINQGDIDQQSLAGAISTGTHGTGAGLPCLSALVEGFELMTAEGERLTCNREENHDIFQLGRVALGSLGILTQITMQNRPRYTLKEQLRLCAFDDIKKNLDTWKNQHRHIEFFGFLYSDQVMLKTLDETDAEIAPRQAEFPSEDAILTLCCELTRHLPALNPYLQKLLKVFVKPTTYVDWSNRIFPTPRNTRFNEMEYQLPVEQGMACLEEMLWTLRQHKAPIFFPFEFRYVKADDIALSPFYQRDAISISAHQYHKQDCWQIFNLLEPIFQKYQGRPHWGKLHSMTQQQLCELYPKWDDFMQLRQQLDPQQKWLSPYMQRLLLG
jgi:FAD-linked oxidoreductase